MGFEVVVDGEQVVFLTIEEIREFSVAMEKQKGTRESDHIRVEVKTKPPSE